MERNLHIDQSELNRIAAGEESAFRLLYDTFHQQVYNQALYYLQSPERASDATQEVFLKLWAKRNVLAEVKDLKSFIFILARNIIISDLRKKVFVQYLDEEASLLQEDTSLPDKQLSFKEAMQIVQEAIDHLSPQQKKAYTLSRTEGLSYAEIAKQMDLSPETVKTHIKQALKSLRTYLSERSVDLGLLIIFLLNHR